MNPGKNFEKKNQIRGKLFFEMQEYAINVMSMVKPIILGEKIIMFESLLKVNVVVYGEGVLLKM